MVAGVSSHFELESFFRTLFRTAVFALTFEAECSVRNNSQVCWDVFKIFTGPRDVSAFGCFLCFGFGIRLSVSFMGWHVGGFHQMISHYYLMSRLG